MIREMDPSTATTRWRNPETVRLERAGKSVLFLLLAAAYTVAGILGLARQAPPRVQPPRPAHLPPPSLLVLPNGLRVAVVERHTLPLVTLRLVVRVGAEADSPDLPGTAQMVSSLLTEGTARRSAQTIAEMVDSIGGTVDTGAEWDHSYARLTVLSDYKERAFDLLSDMVLHPAFQGGELERKRRQTLSALEALGKDPVYLADTALGQIALNGTPYGHPADGTLEAISRLAAKDLMAFHARYYRPSNSILAVVGDVKPDEAFKLAGEYFLAWEEGPAPSDHPAASTWPGSRQVVVIDKPGSVQTEIRIANPGIARASSDYYALSLANQILGGPASNRLFRALRTRQGLTYGASSDLVCHRTLGIWVAKTFTRSPETVKTLQVSLEQMKRLREHGISEDELETAKGYLIGHLALEFESSEGIATQVLDLMLYGLPLDYWDTFPARIQALSAKDVQLVIRRFLDPDRSAVVLVGDHSSFRKELKKLGPVRVIPLGSIDSAFANLDRTTSESGKP